MVQMHIISFGNKPQIVHRARSHEDCCARHPLVLWILRFKRPRVKTMALLAPSVEWNPIRRHRHALNNESAECNLQLLLIVI